MTEKRYSAQTFEVDEDYFLWLCQMIGSADPEDGYLGVLRTMYDSEFTDRTAKFVPNDQNRVGDAVALRDRFMKESLYDDYTGIFNNPCSCLEVLIALAFRMQDKYPFKTQQDFFWDMMDNMGLSEWNDEAYFTPMGQDKVYHILRNWRFRKYDFDGKGGPFPLKEPESDQRRNEIWYQMNAYMIENYM